MKGTVWNGVRNSRVTFIKQLNMAREKQHSVVSFFCSGFARGINLKAFVFRPEFAHFHMSA
jgi:hypothetical protein